MRPRTTFFVLLGAGALVSRGLEAEEGKGKEEEVTVRAPPLSPALGAKDPSVAGSTVRRAELEAPGLRAADALRTQVGVSLVEAGALGAPATASVRGATAAETPVYVGGIRINDDVAGAADLSSVPLWLMDRVEVYRGNAPLEADRLTLGGAIFFEPLRPDRPRAGAGLLAGSYGSRALYAYSGSGGEAHGLLLGIRLEGAENDYTFEDSNGTPFVSSDDRVARLENADATLLDAWLLGRASAGKARFEVLANHFEREQGATSLASVRTEAARQTLTRSLGSVSGTVPLGASARLELRSAGLFGRAVTTDPGLELALGSERLEARGERVEQQLVTSVELGPHRLRAGVDAASERLRRYEGTARAGESPVVDAQRMTARAVAGAELELAPWLSLRPLGSLECHATTRGAGGACDALEPAARIAALARWGALSVFGGAARYARVPTLGELYGMSLAVHGNPELRSEAGITLDAGARFTRRLDGQVSPLYLALSGYVREARDLVTFVMTSQRYIEPQNLAEARLMGLEAEAGAGFLRFFSAEAGATLLDGRDRTPGRVLANDVLPYRSRLIASSALAATTPELGEPWLARAALRVSFVYQSNRYANPGGVGTIPEQSSLDVDGSLAALGGSVVLRARVADLLDSERFDIVGYPLPRRSVFVTLELTTPEHD